MERRTLNDKDFESLSKMINSGDENYKLVLNIIDNCNVEESFMHILCLAPQRWESNCTMSSKIFVQRKVYKYIISLVKDINKIPSFGSLNFLIDLWTLHCESNKTIASAKDIKKICKHYKNPNVASWYDLGKVFNKK